MTRGSTQGSLEFQLGACQRANVALLEENQRLKRYLEIFERIVTLATVALEKRDAE